MKFILPFLILVMLPLSGSIAQPASIFQYFHQRPDSIPVLKFETNWTRLVRTKMAEQYQDAILSFYKADGSLAVLGVKIRARGNVRKEVCYYPPLKIKFQKGDLSNLSFNDMNEVKLVFPCRTGEKDADYLLREALIYRLYEVIHPIHLETQIIRLECWQDGKEKLVSYGLLIEHNEEFISRLSARVVEKGFVNSGGLDRDSYLKMVFFQYMILNTDWSVPNRHNLLITLAPGYDRLVPVPYDFDYSGFVDAPYSIPADVLPIKGVTEPYFLGIKVTKEEALQTAQYFLSKKEEIFHRCHTFGWLSERSRKTLSGRLDDFFGLLENEKLMLATFVTD